MVGDGLLLPSAVVWFLFRPDDPFARNGIRLCLDGAGYTPGGALLFWSTGQYKGLTRYGQSSFYQLALGNGLLMLFLLAFGEFFHLPSPPRSCWLFGFVRQGCAV